VAAAESSVRDLAERAVTAVEAAAQAHRARIAGIAGELARALLPGEPCPVCGSPEHPAPAVAADGDAPDPDAAEAARAAAQEALTGANARLAALRERLAARRAEAGEDPEGAVDAAAAVLLTAHGAAERLAAVDADVAALDARLAEGQREVDAATARLDADERVAAAQAAALDADEAEVLAAADGLPSVRHRDEDLRRRADQARAWAATLEAFVLATEAERDAVRERDVALGEAGLDLDDVLLARLPRADLDALRAAVDAHVAARARVDDGLGRLPADLPADEAALDLRGARAALEAADRHAAGAGDAAAVLTRRAAAAADALDALRAADRDLDTARSAAAPVTRMANLAAASGGEGDLTLASYVLAQRFEDLVAAANARLSGISDGRYELVRSTEREDVRSRRLGLALTVQDHRTGRSRDPRTLSGGETFYVSLCLALGLADVVTAEAGGLELGTLLVDEGFGSLDAETLEVVLAELCRLRDGGRTVGVVSHVDALKQSIAERVEVRRLPGGSSTLTVRA
jgi:exonuclease SbcC